MAFLKRNWLARIGVGLNKFIIGEKDASGKQTLTNSPVSVTQEGDVSSADNLNDLEQRIYNAFVDGALTKVWENPSPSTAWSSSAISLGGAYPEIVLEYASDTTHLDNTSFIHLKSVGDGHQNVFTACLLYVNAGLPTEITSRQIEMYKVSGETRLWVTGGATTTITASSVSESTANQKLIPIAIYAVGSIYNS